MNIRQLSLYVSRTGGSMVGKGAYRWSGDPGRQPMRFRALLSLLLALLSATALAGELQTLPDSLGQWYKPANKRQVWLHTMFAMRRELQAVREYTAAGENELAARWVGKLAKHYRSLERMVPEWQDETETELIDALQKAVSANDPRAIERTARRVANNCRACHRQFQALAALRYRWPHFDSLAVPDGQGGQLPYDDFMQRLSGTLNRVKIAADDGRWEAAKDSLASLGVQLHRLGRGCVECHKDPQPRERILGKRMDATLDQLLVTLQGRDARGAGRRLGEMAVQTCARCHGVHRLITTTQRFLFD